MFLANSLKEKLKNKQIWKMTLTPQTKPRSHFQKKNRI